MIPKPMTMEDFAAASCGNPNCHDPYCAELVFHSRCHPTSPTWVTVDKRNKVLIVSCAICDKVITQVAIRPF